MKTKFTIIAIIIILILLINTTEAQKTKTDKAKVDPEFVQFWKEFQSAIVKADKNKIAEMTQFPIQGEYVNQLFASDNKKSHSNNKKGFIAYGYNKIFGKFTTEFIKEITSIKNGTIKGKARYEFISLKELSKRYEGHLPDFLKNKTDGYQLRFDNAKGQKEFFDLYDFAKIDGKYKFLANEFENEIAPDLGD